MFLCDQAEWLVELARLRHARNFSCLLDARHLPRLLAHEGSSATLVIRKLQRYSTELEKSLWC